MKKAGIFIILLGLGLTIVTAFTFFTKEKVVDLGPIQIEKKENHPIQWSPIVGVVLLIGGIVVISQKKSVS